MNKNLLANNYLIVRNFIPKEEALDLGLNFFKFCKYSDKKGKSDGQVSKATSVFSPSVGVEFLNKKCDELSNIVGCKLSPTYSYARVYENGSFLPIHKDKPACEISVTLHLNGDTSWPIHIVNPQGLPLDVNLQPGDIMIYLGCFAHHWRVKYTGKNYAQLFLHYVRSNGVYSLASTTAIKENFKKLREEYTNYLPTFTSYYHDRF